MPAILLGGAILLPIWLAASILVSPLYLFEGWPRKAATTVWKVFPNFMKEAASPY